MIRTLSLALLYTALAALLPACADTPLDLNACDGPCCAAGIHDDGTGSCAPLGQCAQGFHDDGTGACAPQGQCASSLHDDGTGTCVAAGLCAEGYANGGDGRCLPTGQCSGGFHQGGGGNCVAIGSCDPNYHDDGTGLCVPLGQCAEHFHDDGAGGCAPQGQCAPSFHDDGTGACIAAGLCADGYANGGDGRCLPTGQCSEGFRQGGGSLCVPTGSCAASYHDDGLGTCVTLGLCADGYQDGGAGACVAIGSCSSGFRQDGAGLCRPTGSCAEGFHDGGDGSCVQKGSCIADYHDGGDGKCRPAGLCSTDYWDNGVGVCIPVGACAYAFHDDGTGTCVTNLAHSWCAAGFHDDGVGRCLGESASPWCAEEFHDDGMAACVSDLLKRPGPFCAAGFHDNGEGRCVADNSVPACLPSSNLLANGLCCAPGEHNSDGLCCPLDQQNNGRGSCVTPGMAPCALPLGSAGGLCCAANEHNSNNLCCPPGAESDGAGRCTTGPDCAPGTARGETLCCPEGMAESNGVCCEPGKANHGNGLCVFGASAIVEGAALTPVPHCDFDKETLLLTCTAAAASGYRCPTEPSAVWDLPTIGGVTPTWKSSTCSAATGLATAELQFPAQLSATATVRGGFQPVLTTRLDAAPAGLSASYFTCTPDSLALRNPKYTCTAQDARETDRWTASISSSNPEAWQGQAAPVAACSGATCTVKTGALLAPDTVTATYRNWIKVVVEQDTEFAKGCTVYCTPSSLFPGSPFECRWSSDCILDTLDTSPATESVFSTRLGEYIESDTIATISGEQTALIDTATIVIKPRFTAHREWYWPIGVGRNPTNPCPLPQYEAVFFENNGDNPPESNYIISPSGLVALDKTTGLKWQRHPVLSQGPIGEGPFLGTAGTEYSVANYCATLSLDDLKDWQIPTLVELTTIAIGEENEIYSPVFGADCPKGNYWHTSTSLTGSGDQALGCAAGNIAGRTSPGYGYVRCVHR